MKVFKWLIVFLWNLIVCTEAFFGRSTGLWAKGVVYYNVAPELTPVMRSSIKYGIEYINSLSCVKWKQRLPHYTLVHDYVSFQYLYAETTPQCLSAVGRAGGQQELELGVGCMAAYPVALERHTVVLHEMMHTMGLYHEHQRPDRDCYVAIDPPSLATTDPPFQIRRGPEYWSDWPYDYESVMHYPEQLSLYPHDPNHTLYRRDGTVSPSDIERLEFLYCGQPSYCNRPGGRQRCDVIAQQEAANPYCTH